MWSSVPTMPNYWATPMVFHDRHDYFPQADIFQYYDGSVITAYMVADQLDRFRTEQSVNYLDPTYFAKYEAQYEREKRDWWDWIRHIEGKDYERATSEELSADHQQFLLNMRDAICFFGSTRPEFTHAAERRLEEILRGAYEENWSAAFTTLATSPAPDDVQLESRAWDILKGSSPTDAALLAHASRYPWLVFGQFTDKGVLAFLRDRLREPADHAAPVARDLVREQREILDRLSPERQEAEYLSRFLQSQGLRRMDIKAYWAGCYFLARRFWLRLALHLNIELHDLLKYVTPPEVDRLLRGEAIGDVAKLLETRRGAYAIQYEKGGEIIILAGDDARAKFKELIQSEGQSDATELKGQVACVGSYRGTVRKVVAGDLDMLTDAISAFQPGEVLVTSMTQPNMMVIAKRAGAIVTDEGGITSHAAIISRELNIPCIVGCLKAMRTLNDGDEVEVDAKKGIVRVLKK